MIDKLTFARGFSSVISPDHTSSWPGCFRLQGTQGAVKSDITAECVDG